MTVTPSTPVPTVPVTKPANNAAAGAPATSPATIRWAKNLRPRAGSYRRWDIPAIIHAATISGRKKMPRLKPMTKGKAVTIRAAAVQ